MVPARDEAAVLPHTLPSLLSQDYPGTFRVVLVDDASSDGTGETAAELGRRVGRAGALTVVAGTPPPPGWAGKVWAMAQGTAAAREVGVAGGRGGGGAHQGSGGGEWGVAGGREGAAAGDRAAGGREGSADECACLLFTDADIQFAPGTLTALVSAALADDRALVSQMALLRAQTRWERWVVPAFVYFFAQLYPFRRVGRPGGRTAAAAGGCMLVRAGALAKAGGLAGIRGAHIDDIALARLLKFGPARARCWLGFTTDVRSVRPYPRLADLWDMIARSAYTQLRYSPALLAGTLAGLGWLYVVPPATAVAGTAAWAMGAGTVAGWAAVTGWVGWALMSVSYLPVLRLYGLSAGRAPTLPAVAVVYAAMTADSARRHRRGRGGEWKGRVLRVR